MSLLDEILELTDTVERCIDNGDCDRFECVPIAGMNPIDPNDPVIGSTCQAGATGLTVDAPGPRGIRPFDTSSRMSMARPPPS